MYVHFKFLILLSLFLLLTHSASASSASRCLSRALSLLLQNFRGTQPEKTEIRVNEFVKIIGPSPEEVILAYPELTKDGDRFLAGYKLSFPRNYIDGKEPVLARVLSISDGKAVVEWKHLRSGSHHYLQVPIQDLEPLPVGGQDGFRSKIAPLLALDLNLGIGETARYRLPDGRISVGKIRATEPERVLIEVESGDRLWVRKEEVFKARTGKTESEPKTPQYRDQLVPELAGQFPGEGFDSPRGAYRALLNAAAKLNSSLLAQGASEESIAKAMVRLVNSTVKSNLYGWGATDFGAISIEEIICIGGVCRHKSRVVASMLSEIGLNPKIMYADKGLVEQIVGQRGGHEWIEVDLSTRSGEKMTFVVDPMHPDGVFPLSKSINQQINSTDPARVKIHGLYRSPLRVEQYR